MKKNKLIALSTLTLGASLIYPKIKGSSKKQLQRLDMKYIDDPQTLENLRSKSYYEIFTAYRIFNKFKIGVYNNIKRLPIPVADSDRFDAEALKKELGAAMIIFNGPRFWVLDGIRGYYTGEPMKFFGYEFDLVATIENKISDLKVQAKERKPYIEQTIGRYTDFIFNKGEKIFELVSDTGVIYTMQSASLEINKDQTISDFDSLSAKLKLPDGWIYRARMIEEDICFKIRGEAHVIQDDLRNTYQRNPA
ncbi:MAG: hypothetical protein IPL53_25375 [Ignavibacteria bacterium]|nr:hypothetical protein [Ignavibacteria bacterium]